jgi:hypothetical protein
MQARVGHLYFAGEATDEAYNGFVQGAYNSGKVVVQAVLEDLKQEDAAAARILAASTDDEDDAEVANGEYLNYSSTRRNLQANEREEEQEGEEEGDIVGSHLESKRAGGTEDLEEELDAELIEFGASMVN